MRSPFSNRTISIASSLLFILILTNCKSKVWLDELDLSPIDQSAGNAVANKSMWNTPLIIAGDTFQRGVGTHASGMIRIKLNDDTKRFHAKVGLDDSPPEHERRKASVEFIVYADGVEIWNSGIMKAGDKAKVIDLELKQKKNLDLFVDHAGDGISGDRANWVDAWFETTGSMPETYHRKPEREYILTPKLSLKPVINAPYIFSARPGNPVLFTIPVSGERPIQVKASNLPAGLVLCTETGKVTGEVSMQGNFSFDVIVENRHGKNTRTLQLIVGEMISPTPPMGWNSWNAFGKGISQEKVEKAAKAMVESGLSDFGYTYINIDDGWQGERGGKYNAIMPNDKFPDMKSLVDQIHGLGLKAGIYSSPWVWTYAGFTGGSADAPDGKILQKERRLGKYGFEEQDVKQFVEWGFDYIKYDWNPNDVEHTAIMSEKLRESGRDIVFSISNAAPYELAEEWSHLTNLWRTTFDIHDSWYSLTAIGFSQDPWQPFAGPGHWNDPDMLIVGNLGWGNRLHKTRLSPNEQYLHISLWSILAAPMMIGCDLTSLDSFTFNLLANKEVLEVNQDPAGIQGKRIKSDKSKQIEIWSRPLADGAIAVGLFNLSDSPRNISVSWEDLGLKGHFLVRDLWRQADLGIYQSNYSTEVPDHGVALLKFSPGINKIP